MKSLMADINNWIVLILLILYVFSVVSCVIVVLKENRNPIRSLAWVLALIFLPVVGLVFYLFFGRSLKGQTMMSRHNRRKMMNKFRPPRVNLSSQSLTPEDRSLVKLVHNLCHSPYCVNNDIKILNTGREKFESLKKDLLNAEKSIFLQYYIFSDDTIGNEIARILIDKARSGVEVKVIYDPVGSFSTPNKFFRNLAANGVEIHPFFRVTFRQLANRINWRNHRKIVVVDGRIGYIGGMNIADRYRLDSSEGMAWRDTHYRLEGDIVESLMCSFLIDWNFKNPKKDLEYPEIPPVGIRNDVGMQFVPAGPMSQYDNIALSYMKAISGATRSVYIQTPYFLPTDGLLHALEAAAMADVDVRVMIPRKSDSRMLQYASFSYVTQCLKAGIKVYVYDPGMIHAKTLIIDDTLTAVGSANFDFRSFENNFECMLMVYDRDFNKELRNLFFSDMRHCTKLTVNSWHSRPRFQRTLESIVRLVAPIL